MTTSNVFTSSEATLAGFGIFGIEMSVKFNVVSGPAGFPLAAFTRTFTVCVPA